MTNNIHFESEHKVYIGETHAGTIVMLDVHDGNGCSYVFSPEHNWESDFTADELRAIALKLDTLNNVDTDEEVGGGWISWEGEEGSPGPLPPGREVEVLFRGGTQDQGPACFYDWSSLGDNIDIIAYRVIEED